MQMPHPWKINSSHGPLPKHDAALLRHASTFKWDYGTNGQEKLLVVPGCHQHCFMLDRREAHVSCGPSCCIGHCFVRRARWEFPQLRSKFQPLVCTARVKPNSEYASNNENNHIKIQHRIWWTIALLIWFGSCWQFYRFNFVHSEKELLNTMCSTNRGYFSTKIMWL